VRCRSKEMETLSHTPLVHWTRSFAPCHGDHGFYAIFYFELPVGWLAT
jgi:hypothetical protein